MMIPKQLGNRFNLESEDVKRVALVAAMALTSLMFGFLMTDSAEPLQLIAIPLVLVIAYLGFNNPELLTVALLGITWGYVSEVMVKFQGTPSLSKPIVTLLIVILLIRRFGRQKKPLVYHPMMWWMLGYFLVICAGMWYAVKPERTLLIINDFAKELMLFFVITNMISSEGWLKRGLLVMLIIGGIYGTLTVYQELVTGFSNDFYGFARSSFAQISDEFANRPRAGGPTSEPNAYGQQLLVLIPIGLWMIMSARKWVARAIGIWATIACLLGIALSFSRGAYLAVGMMFVMLVMHLRLNPRYLLLIPLIWMGLSLAPAEMRSRFGTLNTLLPSSQNVESDASINRRSVEMLMAAYMFIDHPFIGVGADNYIILYPTYLREYGGDVPDEQRNAHSYYLEIAAEHGLLGLSVVGGIFLLTLKNLKNARRWFEAAGQPRMAELAVMMRIAFMGYMISAVFLHGDYSRFLWQQVDIGVACALVAAGAYRRAFGTDPTTETEATEQPEAQQPRPAGSTYSNPI